MPAVAGEVSRKAKADPLCLAAVAEARSALLAEEDPSVVGEHLGVQAEGDRLLTHYFAATLPGYPGWRWAVTLARAPRARIVTVCEVALLPGEDAVLAPPWVPWQERLEPGDLRAGGILPVAADDERLVPGWADPDDSGARISPTRARPGSDVADLVVDLWLTRDRVLSVEGREQAAQRWSEGEGGPRSAVAEAAKYKCVTCGFAAPISGTLGQEFAVCANENSPSDGRVVTADHGCGGHSRITPESVGSSTVVSEVAHETDRLEPLQT